MTDFPTKIFLKRLKILVRFFIFLSVIIFLRLFQLQVKNHWKLDLLSKQNFLRIEKIYSPRGDILDCKGRALATNKPKITLYWQGTGNKKFTPEQNQLIQHLEILLSKKLFEDNNFKNAEFTNKKIVLADNINFDVLRCLIEQYPNHKNISFVTTYKRDYPYKDLCSHILGYLGSITKDPTGQMGLEKICDEQLKGTPGELIKQINSRGIQISAEEIKKAQQGDSLKTTIDLDLQKIAEEVFLPDCSGTLIVMNPKNGALQVLLSRPKFDPNIFTETIDPETWGELQAQDKSFLNRAFNALYPPASLFKLVTVSAALETNLIKQSDVWHCCGYTTFGGRQYFCHHHEGHGTLNTMQAIAQSCNIPFFEIGKRIKIDTLAEFANRFGLGLKTSSAFPEKSGLIPTTKWKKQVKKEKWWQGETMSAAIGQSYLLVTPIQMARMIGAIVQGFLITPCILEKEATAQTNSQKSKLNISESTRDFLKKSMMKVTKGGGTGERLGHFSNIEIYAKTGTAQTVSLAKQKHEHTKETRDHAWIITHIQYKDNEPFVLLVLLEHSGLSSIAAGVAKNFIVKYCNLIDKQTIPLEKDLKDRNQALETTSNSLSQEIN